MRDKDAPFVVYRRPTGYFTIVPRGFKGWAQITAWIALLVPLIILFENHAKGLPGEPASFDGLGPFCIAIVVWLVGGVWWVFAHSEEVDVAELTRDKYMQERKRRRSE
jgi:hypothetical protein